MPRPKSNGAPTLDARGVANMVVQEVIQTFYRRGHPLPIDLMQEILASVDQKVATLTNEQE